MNWKYTLGLALAFIITTPVIGCIGAAPDESDDSGEQTDSESDAIVKLGTSFDVAASAASKSLGVGKWTVTPFENTTNHSHGVTVSVYSTVGFNKTQIGTLSFVGFSDTSDAEDGHGYVSAQINGVSQKMVWKTDTLGQATSTQSMLGTSTPAKIAKAFTIDARGDARRKLGVQDCIGASLVAAGSGIVEAGACLTTPLTGVTAVACAGGFLVFLGAGVQFHAACFPGT